VSVHHLAAQAGDALLAYARTRDLSFRWTPPDEVMPLARSFVDGFLDMVAREWAQANQQQVAVQH
jgi:hypothetical protein